MHLVGVSFNVIWHYMGHVTWALWWTCTLILCLQYYNRHTCMVKLVIKPRIFRTVARQPALTWQAVWTQIVVRGLKCYTTPVWRGCVKLHLRDGRCPSVRLLDGVWNERTDGRTNEETRRPSVRSFQTLSKRRMEGRTVRGGDLGGKGGIVPLKKLGGGDGSAFIPPIFRKCLAERFTM